MGTGDSKEFPTLDVLKLFGTGGATGIEEDTG